MHCQAAAQSQPCHYKGSAHWAAQDLLPGSPALVTCYMATQPAGLLQEQVSSAACLRGRDSFADWTQPKNADTHHCLGPYVVKPALGLAQHADRHACLSLCRKHRSKAGPEACSRSVWAAARSFSPGQDHAAQRSPGPHCWDCAAVTWPVQLARWQQSSPQMRGSRDRVLESYQAPCPTAPITRQDCV